MRFASFFILLLLGAYVASASTAADTSNNTDSTTDKETKAASSDDAADDADVTPPQTTAEKLRHVLEEHVDADGDGRISKSEVIEWLFWLEETSLTKSLKGQIESMDTNKDGFVSLEEILAAELDDENDTSASKMIENRFKAMDFDGDKNLTFDEVYDYLNIEEIAPFVQVETNYVFHTLDKNTDDKLNVEEFKFVKGSMMNEDLEEEMDGEEGEEDEESRAKLFKTLDEDSDNIVSKAELESFFRKKREAAQQEVVDEMTRQTDAFFNSTKPILEKEGVNEDGDVSVSIDSIIEDPQLVEEWATGQLTERGEVLDSPDTYFNENSVDPNDAAEGGSLGGIGDGDGNSEDMMQMLMKMLQGQGIEGMDIAGAPEGSDDEAEALNEDEAEAPKEDEAEAPKEDEAEAPKEDEAEASETDGQAPNDATLDAIIESLKAQGIDVGRKGEKDDTEQSSPPDTSAQDSTFDDETMDQIIKSLQKQGLDVGKDVGKDAGKKAGKSAEKDEL